MVYRCSLHRLLMYSAWLLLPWAVVSCTESSLRLQSNDALDEVLSEVVLLRDIPFQSHCEHHMAPIVGKAHIAYLPGDYVVGISKLARVLHAFANRLQVQERLTSEVANCIWEHLKPQGVAVVIEATHGCMTGRGVRTPNVIMKTSRMLGVFRDDEKSREEVLKLISS